MSNPSWIYNTSTKRWDAPPGFWVGPGNWLYYVSPGNERISSSGGGVQKVQIAYSPTRRAWIYQALSGDVSAKVLDELRTKGGVYLGSQATAAKQAYEKKYGGVQPSAVPARSSSPAPSAPSVVAEPDFLTQTREAASKNAPYLIVGGGLLIAGLILFWPSKKEAVA